MSADVTATLETFVNMSLLIVSIGDGDQLCLPAINYIYSAITMIPSGHYFQKDLQGKVRITPLT